MQNNIQTTVESFQNLCVEFATGKDTDFKDYEEERNRILSIPTILHILPDWISKNRYGSQFWSFIKDVSPNYQGRRKFLYDAFSPILDYIEKGTTKPVSMSFDEIKLNCNSKAIEAAWARAHERRNNDPEGVITAARSLVESTCIFILEKSHVEYKKSDDLNALYKKVALVLDLSPSKDSIQVFKKLLSGCYSIIDGLASLRNSLGDAHGKSADYIEPTVTHADFAINLAGSISTFLIATYEKRIS